MRILMVEDEIYIAEAIIEILKKNNYSVDLAIDGEYGLDSALTDIYDLIILDIMVPKINGLNILKEIRRHKIDTPVILLTAKDSIEDKVAGLDYGADDYLSKPFHTNELLARLRALSRREQKQSTSGTFTFEDIELNPHTLTLSSNNKEVLLTLKEAQILEILIKQPKTIHSKQSLIEKVWGYDSEAEENRVEIQIHLLRKKLADLKTYITIKTIRNHGYILKVIRRSTN